MIYRRYLHFLFSLSLILLLLAQISCEKFSGDQEIAAYIKVDSITLTTDYGTQGSNSQSITDVWAYVDDNLIGGFQMPAKFPVLAQGKHTVTFFAGVKKNGIAATRISYPFYAKMVQTIDLKPDSTVSVGVLHATYETSAFFYLKEDFESAGVAFDTTPRSLVNLTKTPVGSPLTYEGNHSGLVTMDATNNYFEFITHSSYPIPNAPVYLEMNFNTNNQITVGAIVYMAYSLYEVPIITLVSTNGQWKKIYIELTNTINAYTGATGFKIFFEHFQDAGVSNAQILFDNIKIVTSK
jgi:hypothetical protein